MRSPQEFQALLQPVLGTAYGVAHQIVRSRDDAEDVVQEAAVRAFRDFDSFEPGTNFKAWFLRIVTNLSLNEYRRKQRSPEKVSVDDADDLYLYNQTKRAGLHKRNSDPAALVLGRLSEEQIHGAIASLPDEYRAGCALYFLEELSYQEIADILECPVGTVRSRLHRGRKILQRALWEIAG